MKRRIRMHLALTGPILFLACASGCAAPGTHILAETPRTLGSIVDQAYMTHEVNAEAAKFIVYQHEFELNQVDLQTGSSTGGLRLNDYGEDHLKEIAVNLKHGVTFPVVVERNQTSAEDGTEYHYPVHFDHTLDAERRRVVVAALTTMGVPNAEEVVVVAPSFAEGYTAPEAAQAYQRSFNGLNYGYGGYGGFGTFGGFGGGGFGGFGGFGGGFF